MRAVEAWREATADVDEAIERADHVFDDPDNGNGYGAQWWVVPGSPHGAFWANGYEGQSIMVCPGLDLVVVRLGKSTVECYPALASWRAAVVDAFR